MPPPCTPAVGEAGHRSSEPSWRWLVFPWIVDEDRGGGMLELGSGGIGALRQGLQLPGKFVLQSTSTKKKSSAKMKSGVQDEGDNEDLHRALGTLVIIPLLMHVQAVGGSAFLEACGGGEPGNWGVT